MPVLPAVPSTIVPPGCNSPRASASSTMNSAARSFTEAPGLANSHLPKISQPAASLGPLRRTSGVLPISASVLLAVAPVMIVWLGRTGPYRNANALFAGEEALGAKAAPAPLNLPRRS